MFGEVLNRLRTERKLNMDQLVKEINTKYGTAYSKSMVSRWENNITDPKMESVRILADYFDVSIDEFLELDQPVTEKKSQEAIDVANEIQKIINDLNNKDAVYNGESLDPDDRETLKSSLENTLNLFRYISKKKNQG